MISQPHLADKTTVPIFDKLPTLATYFSIEEFFWQNIELYVVKGASQIIETCMNSIRVTCELSFAS